MLAKRERKHVVYSNSLLHAQAPVSDGGSAAEIMACSHIGDISFATQTCNQTHGKDPRGAGLPAPAARCATDKLLAPPKKASARATKSCRLIQGVTELRAIPQSSNDHTRRGKTHTHTGARAICRFTNNILCTPHSATNVTGNVV